MVIELNGPVHFSTINYELERLERKLRISAIEPKDYGNASSFARKRSAKQLRCSLS
jgi:hypothetical protein